jgi:hypothetical protein
LKLTNQQNKEVLYNFANKLKDLNIKEICRTDLIKYLTVFIEKAMVYKDKVEVIYKFEHEPKTKNNKKTLDSQKI